MAKIQITESELKQIIRESVENVLNEMQDEGLGQMGRAIGRNLRTAGKMVGDTVGAGARAIGNAASGAWNAGKAGTQAVGAGVGNALDQAGTAIGKAAIAQEMKLIEPILEKQARIGANASLAYMALISNTDVYQDMLDAGATKREAALVALGSTLGMYKVDRSGIGELFFDDLTAVHTKQVRQMLKKELQSWKDTITSQINNPITKGPNKLLNLIT